jgi:sugar lactone lactonase YvrE
MKIDGKGNLYVAQWSGGKVLKISADGKLRHVFIIRAGTGTTNVAFGKDSKDLYVTSSATRTIRAHAAAS